MGKFHATGWSHTPAQISAIYDKSPERARELTEQFGGQPVTSLDALFDAVDVVDICTPTPLHHAMALQAFGAGKHVICEKPLARTPEQAAEIVAASEQAGKHLLVGHVVRFFPEYAQAKAIVDGGELGRVGVVRLRRVSGVPGWASDNWLMDPEKSGGILLDLMVHDFDYARWVAGEVESVFAKNVRSHSPDHTGDYAQAILRHTNGALSHIEGGWAYPTGMFRTALEIAGDQGLIEHPSGRSTPIEVHLKDMGDKGAVPVPGSPLKEPPHTTQIKHFYDVIAHDAVPRVTGPDGLAAVRIAFAALESIRTGQRVTL